jgi:hypothetical protein
VLLGAFGGTALLSTPPAFAVKPECAARYDIARWSNDQGDYYWGDIELRAYSG